ncbi:MAG: amino acid adenylation domain-containing protein [Cytophagales bacterium]|nr:amino acid adenylation domain-containing protein [Cytophagales bacterium]
MTTSTPTLLGLLNQRADNAAVFYKEQHISHGEVDILTQNIALHLINSGIQKGDRVAICVDPGPDLPLAILGILKAGAVFVPLDTNIPKDRMKYMIQDSEAKYCIWNGATEGIHLSIDELKQRIQPGGLPSVEANDAAYVIYTSGTTGKPKGVIVSHGAILAYLKYAWDTYIKQEGNEVIALITSPSVDMTLTSLLLPFITGNTLAIYNSGSNLQNLVAALKDERVTFLKCTPTHLSMISEENASHRNITTFVVGGEALTRTEAIRISNLFQKADIFNEYGPTEATVGCVVQQYDGLASSAYVPIGQPVPSASILLLDSNQQPVQAGEKGELYIGGDCLAMGYLNNPKATAARFVEIEGDRYYRSGDVVQYQQGTLQYLGREDDQVKIRGYRVEPAEISEVILSYPGIENANVSKEGHQLHAYLKTKDVELEELMAFLSKKLPSWMVPTQYFLSDHWMVKANGKLDLEQMRSNAKKLTSTDQPSLEDTENITDLIKRLIIANSRIKRLTKGTNLFHAGMESIQLVNLVVDLEEQFNCRISMGPVVCSPTLETLVRSVQTARDQPVFSKFNEGIDATAVYCFPAAIGGPMAFRELIKGDQDHLYRTLEDPGKFMDPLKSYADALTKDDHFPCVLLGYSGGGNLAFEVCKLLEAKGKKVSAIIMIDAFRKRYIPKTMPADIVIMKEEAMAQLGDAASDNALEDLSRYYDLVNFELNDFEGSVKADVYLLTSENRTTFGDRKVDGVPFFHPWSNCTKGNFKEIQGAGNHEDMLKKPWLGTNSQLISQILKAY